MRGSNPWVALVALILLLVLIVCTCTGCEDTAEAAEKNNPRFVVEKASDNYPMIECYIIEDTETGVRYLYCNGSNKAGLTKLEEGE